MYCIPWKPRPNSSRSLENELSNRQFGGIACDPFGFLVLITGRRGRTLSSVNVGLGSKQNYCDHHGDDAHHDRNHLSGDTHFLMMSISTRALYSLNIWCSCS
jgi:hypothetical protein